mgnify:FL=1
MAEIQKKIKICPNGHPYDPSRFESCPICSNGGFAPTLDPFAPDSMSATVDPGQQNMGSFAQTAPPDSGYQNQHYMPESYSQFTPLFPKCAIQDGCRKLNQSILQHRQEHLHRL